MSYRPRPICCESAVSSAKGGRRLTLQCTMRQSHSDIGKGSTSQEKNFYPVVLPMAIVRSMLNQRVSGFCLVRNSSKACSQYSGTALKDASYASIALI